MVASGPWVGGSARDGGGWRMSLETTYRSLTKHLGEISHALLASRMEKRLECLSRDGRCLRTHRKQNPGEGHHVFFEESGVRVFMVQV